MSYRVIAWDFDGTLVDSLDGALEIYNDLAREYGFVVIEDPAPVRAMTIPAFLKAHRIPLRKVPALYARFLRAQTSRLPAVRLHESVQPLLEEMLRRGCRLVVISSNTARNIRICLRANGVEDLFEEIIGYSRLRGKESAIRRLIRSQHIKPAELLYVGDEVRDITAARKAGVDMASVAWGFNSEETLQEHEPDYLARTPQDFYPLLERWQLELD